MRLAGALASRLRVEETYRAHPEIDDEQVEGPVFVIGLPRTGTTALSQLVAADPQFRSLRLWESSRPLPAARVGDRAHRSADRRRPRPASR